MGKYICVGALIGIAVGYLLPFVFPKLFEFDAIFKMMANKQLGYSPDYYSPKSGGILTGSGIILALSGALGAFFGFLIYKTITIFKKK